jgi:hypothetical protein
MGYIKEPKGVDFVVNGKPLTEKQKEAISAFIKADKAGLDKQKSGGLKKSKTAYSSHAKSSQ